MRMTLKKIGELAGVSTACVSNILNGKTEEYAAETCKRVKAIANEHNYRPNSIAKSMVTKSTMTLGLILPDITNPYYPELAKGVETRAFERGYNVIYLNSDEDPEKEKKAFRTLEQKMVDGVIFIPSVTSANNEKVFNNFPVPIVAVDRMFEFNGIQGLVTADDYLGSCMATEYLLEQEQRDILFLSGDRYYGLNSDRAKGFFDTMEKHHVKVKVGYARIGQYHAEFGYDAVKELIKAGCSLDGVYAGSDMIAIGALQALQEEGLAVAEEVSLIGYDDIYMSRFLNPPLTTIRQPKYEMGTCAVDMLLELIQNEKSDIEKKIVLKPELIIRKSVGRKKSKI